MDGEESCVDGVVAWAGRFVLSCLALANMCYEVNKENVAQSEGS